MEAEKIVKKSKYKGLKIFAVIVVLLAVGIASFFYFGDPTRGKVTVSFDTDGGETIVSQTFKRGGKAVRPEDPAKDGFTFGGWLLSGSEYDFDLPVNVSFTLKASWIKDEGPTPDDGKDQQENASKDGKKDETPSPSEGTPAPAPTPSSAPEPEPKPQWDPNKDYGIVLSVAGLKNLKNQLMSLGASNGGIVGGISQVGAKGIQPGMAVYVSVSYPDGTVISSGFTVPGEKLSSLEGTYVPDLRKVIEKGFCEGQEIGISVVYPDTTVIGMGMVVSAGDVGPLTTIAAGY